MYNWDSGTKKPASPTSTFKVKSSGNGKEWIIEASGNVSSDSMFMTSGNGTSKLDIYNLLVTQEPCGGGSSNGGGGGGGGGGW